MSDRAFLDLELGDYFYTIDFNTTKLPRFRDKTYMVIPVDIIITNLITLHTNPEI
jgi:hypothetical protein